MTTTTKELVVLIVEDNFSNFSLMARLLKPVGICCEWKSSGYEVVEYTSTIPHIDLILMDIRLPYEDGYQALEKLRSSNLKDIPVLAVTAYASDEQMKKARQAGFDGFLGKPLDADRFPQQVLHVIAGEQIWEIN